MTTTVPDAPAEVVAADARIAVLRSHIDSVDHAIIRLVEQRIALSHEVGAIRAAAGGTRLSLKRENEIIGRFRAALGPEGSRLALQLLRASRGKM